MNNHPRHTTPYRAAVILTQTLACALLSLSTAAPAAGGDGAGLVQQRRCYACHAMNENLLGPSYQAIATRHALRKEVMVEVLAEKIIVGGAGNWGVVPMVPNEQVSLDEARTIARWILKINPAAGGR
jgi:cytochrome c